MPTPEQVPTCYRHPAHRAGVACQRCGRPICPQCMIQASVGFHCPDCVHQGARAAPTYTPQTLPNQVPFVTYGLIAINAIVFVLELVTMTRGASVIGGVNGRVYQEGVLYGPAVGAGEWWRLVTSGFLHAGILHIGMNMFVLYMIGPQLERLLGPLRFIALYVAALLAGALGVMLVSPQSPTLGASGAIFGLLGAAAAYQLSNGISLMRSGLGNLIFINVVITFAFSSSISVGGHIGGLVGGAACGWLMFQLEQRQQPWWIGVLVGLAVAIVFAGSAIAIAPSVVLR